MHVSDTHSIHDFWVVGINYKKTDASVRGSFAVSNEQYEQMLALAPEYGFTELFVLSTCNRTEMYGVSGNAQNFIDLLFRVCSGDKARFAELAYIKNDTPAIEHLFQVAAGLDSQILGDFEILGQIKIAVKFAKSKGFIGSFTERLLNHVMQSSKAVRTHTGLSGGTVSVAFAAIQYIRQHVTDIKNKKIVLLGTGKIGRNTCLNLIHYLGTHNITLVNRTYETAANLAADLKLNAVPIEELQPQLDSADIIIVSTNASQPIISKAQLQHNGTKLVIDLSVPCNVAAEVTDLEHVQLVDVDALSRIKDETLENRKAEVPKALELIQHHIGEFREWHKMRRHVPVLKEVKNKLKTISVDESLVYSKPTTETLTREDAIQSVINVMALKMRRYNAAGCHYIEAINEFISHHG